MPNTPDSVFFLKKEDEEIAHNIIDLLAKNETSVGTANKILKRIKYLIQGSVVQSHRCLPENDPPMNE